MKRKDHLKRCRKSSDKIQHSFMSETFNKLGIGGKKYLNIINATCKNPTPKSRHKEENLNIFD